MNKNNTQVSLTQEEGTHGGQNPSSNDVISRVSRALNQNIIPPSCIEIDDNGIFFDLLLYSPYVPGKHFINSLFTSGYYLDDLDYDLFLDFLYFPEHIEARKNTLIADRKAPIIQIAKRIVPIDPKRRGLYRKPIISGDKKSAEYFFEEVYLTMENDESKITDIPQTLSVDEFVAAMWTYGVRYGIDIENVRDAIRDQKKGAILVAQELSPGNTVQPLMVPVISFEIQLGPKNPDAFRTDPLVYKQAYIRVEGQTPIYKKEPGKIGSPGMDIFGTTLSAERLVDFSIDSFRGDGVHIEEREGIEYLVSDYNGFPRIEEGIITQGKNRIQAIIGVHVDPEKVFEQIGMKSGKITLDEGVVSEEDIVLDTRAGSVHAKKDVEANVHATGDIVVEGSVIGTARNNRQNAPEKGILESKNGNIIVSGKHVNNGRLLAKNGTISVTDIANSIIIGQKVIVSGTAFNCIIVAESIVLQDRIIGSHCIVSKELKMREASEKGDHENTVYAFLYDLSDSIKKKQNLSDELKKRMQSIEEDIDRYIIKKVPNIQKFTKEKRIEISRGVIILMSFPEKQGEDTYKPYVKLCLVLGHHIKQSGADWRKLGDLYQRFETIRREIDDEQSMIDTSFEDMKLEITKIIGPISLYQIGFFDGKKLLDLPMDTLDAMIKNSRTLGEKNLFSIKKIVIPRTGSLQWYPKE